MTSDAIIAELRAIPGAPDGLRERVLALTEPAPRFAWSLPRLNLRRSLLVLAPAVIALAVGAAALHGLVSDGTARQPQVLDAVANHGSAGSTLSGGVHAGARTIAPLTRQKATAFGAQALPPSTTRLNRYSVWLRVSVADARLAQATTRAMRIARGYGGYVASVDMNTPGKQGMAALVLRIPTAKVEEAVLRLGGLGRVTAQHVRIDDLQRQANVLQRQIEALQTTIVAIEQKLAGTSLTPEERVRLRYRLDEARQQLAQKTKARGSTVREGTLATVSLTFSVPKAAAVVPHRRGRLDRALHDSGSFLLKELSWLVYALVALGPIVLLAVLAVFGIRTGRRRSETRLLEGA